jgi:pimeloyl-ACP methyl ester carboxylesterase
VVVPRAGHLAPVESPGDVTRVLKEFAEGIRG